MTTRTHVRELDPATGSPGQVPTINAAGTALEYATPSSGGGGGSPVSRLRTQGAKTTDYSIAASASFADLDNTYFSTSIAAVAGDEIEVGFHGQAYANTAGGTAIFAVAVNGSVPAAWAFGHEFVKCDAAGQLYPMHLAFSFTVASGHLVSGSVPIKIQWRGNASTVGLHSATTGTSAAVPQLSIVNWG